MAQQDDPDKSLEWRLENLAALTGFQTNRGETQHGKTEAFEQLKMLVKNAPDISTMDDLDRIFPPEKQAHFLTDEQQLELLRFVIDEIELKQADNLVGKADYKGTISDILSQEHKL